MSLFETDAVPYGPSASTVFADGNSRTFSFIAIAAAATFATCVLSVRQLVQYLNKIQPCTPRTLVILLVCVPPLFAISSMMGLISPRGNGLFQLMRTSATVMASFGYHKVVFWHIGGVPAAVVKIVDMLGDVKDHWLTKIPILIPLRLCIPKVRMSGELLSWCQGYEHAVMMAAFRTDFGVGVQARDPVFMDRTSWCHRQALADLGEVHWRRYGTGACACLRGWRQDSHACLFIDRGIYVAVVTIQSFETVSMLAALYGLLTIFFATR